MKTTTLPFAILALLCAGCLFPTDAVAGDSHQKTSKRTSPPPQPPRQTQMPAAGQPNRQPNRHFPPNYYLNRPMGSATTTPRGFYRDNLSYQPQQGHHGGHGDHHGDTVYVPQPVYYVAPPLFPDDEPLSFGGVRGPDQAVDPDQLGATNSQPVVIEADNIYVVSPDGERGRYTAPELETRNPETSLGHYGNVPTRAPEARPPAPEQPQDPQDVTLSVLPADAVVWLDDEKLGIAGDLAGLLVLEPGVYLLEVEHDELEDQRLFFGVVDQSVDVRVDLTADEPRRRYRVR